jgi:hypothetical protein
MKISKQKSNEIASKMLLKKVEKKNAIKQDLENAVYKWAYSRFDKELKKSFEQFGDYFNRTKKVVLLNNGFNHETVFIKSYIPLINGQYNFVMQVTKIESLEILPIYQKLKSEEDEIKRLQEEVSGVLFGLGTLAKIKEHFPEALPFFPEDSKKEIMVISKDLINRINN